MSELHSPQNEASLSAVALEVRKNGKFSGSAFPRLCKKGNGRLNTKFVNISGKGIRLARDLYVTVVDLRWRFLIFWYCFLFISTWTGFGVIYYLVMLVNGDFDKDADAMDKCMINIEGMPGALLFSLETQTTIGYGYRTLTEHCWLPAIFLCIQSMFGILFESLLIGMTLAKLARSNKRKSTLAFSKRACIGMYNGQLCFMFRLGDLRNNSNLLEAHVRMYFVSEEVTLEGEVIPLTYRDMNVGYDSGEDRIMTITPIVIRHKIDEKSPLFQVSKDNLATSQFEILVVLEGNIEQIGVTAQCRTSYIPSEIVWGHYFRNCIERKKTHFKCNFALFDELYAGENQPNVSAAELSQTSTNRQELEVNTKL